MTKYIKDLERCDISLENFASLKPFVEEKKATQKIKDINAVIKCVANIIASFFPEGYSIDTRYVPEGFITKKNEENVLCVISPNGVPMSVKFAFIITDVTLFLKLSVAIVSKNATEGYFPITLSGLKKCMPFVEDYFFGKCSYDDLFDKLFEEHRKNEEV